MPLFLFITKGIKQTACRNETEYVRLRWLDHQAMEKGGDELYLFDRKEKTASLKREKDVRCNESKRNKIK